LILVNNGGFIFFVNRFSFFLVLKID